MLSLPCLGPHWLRACGAELGWPMAPHSEALPGTASAPEGRRPWDALCKRFPLTSTTAKARLPWVQEVASAQGPGETECKVGSSELHLCSPQRHMSCSCC